MCCSTAFCFGSRGLKAWGIVSALLAIGCLSVGIWVPRAIDRALDDGVNESLVIDATAQADNTDAYRKYVDPNHEDATPTYYTVRFLHVTNPAAVLGGAMPDVLEMGPYVYQKKMYRHNVTFSTNVYAQQIVSYQTQTQYVFLPDRSTGDESDMITNVNLPFIAARTNPVWQLYGPPGARDYFRYWTTQNVTSWLFGWGPGVFPGILGANEHAPNPTAPFDTQFVGAEPDQSVIRQYVQYQGLDSLLTRVSASVVQPSWKSSTANRIGGSDGTVFARHLQDGQTIQIFTSQLWRVVTLGNLNGETVTFKGIDLRRFTIPPVFLQNAAHYPPNGDFYMLGYTGVANLTAAGKPDFYVTKPHYLDADPALLGNVTGLSAPDASRHDTFLHVEPFTGLTMQGAKRLQLSVRVVPVQANATAWWGAGLPNQATGQYVPVYWAEEYAEISDSDADAFVTKVYGAQRASYGLRIAGQAGACVFVVLAVVLLIVAAGKGTSAPVSPSPVASDSDSTPMGYGDDKKQQQIQLQQQQQQQQFGDNRVVPIDAVPPGTYASAPAS